MWPIITVQKGNSCSYEFLLLVSCILADMSRDSQNCDAKDGSSVGCYLALLECVLLVHLTLMGQMKSGDGRAR